MSRADWVRLGLELAAEGVKAGIRRLRARAAALRKKADIDRRHVERRDLSKDRRPR